MSKICLVRFLPNFSVILLNLQKNVYKFTVTFTYSFKITVKLYTLLKCLICMSQNNSKL